MNEQDLDRLLQQPMGEEKLDVQFQKKVKKAMNRSLYGRIGAALLAVLLVGIGLFFGISAGMNAVFYNPGGEEKFLQDGDGWDDGFSMLLEDTIAMHFPGMRCLVVGNENFSRYTASGFGRYEVDVKLENAGDPMVLGGPPTHTCYIRRSKLDTGYAPLVMYVDRFLQPDSQGTVFEDHMPETVQKELGDLPASAQLDVSISFSEYLSSDAVAELIRTYPKVFFQWAALKDQGPSFYQQVAGGMSLFSSIQRGFTPEAQSRYPGYYLPERSQLVGTDLETCLSSHLQLLADHSEFVKMMESRFPNQITVTEVNRRLKQAQQEWACYGLQLVAGTEDLEKLMEQLPVSQVVVNDVKVSRFQKS